MTRRGLGRLVAACVTAGIAALAVPAVAAADRAAYLSQGGGAETQLAFVSGCAQSPGPDDQSSTMLCADGPAQPGPRVALRAGTASLRFELPVHEVVVQIAPPGKPGQALPSTRVDDTRWTVDLPSTLTSGDRVQVSARGGSAATRDAWDAFYVATAEVPVRVSLTNLRARGRTVTATLGVSGARQATFDAYATLEGRRVSTRLKGVSSSTRRLTITLRRATWRAARHRGRLVVRVTTPAGVQRLRLSLPH